MNPMIFLVALLTFKSNAIEIYQMPLMLEDRAYVEDIRATIHPPGERF